MIDFIANGLKKSTIILISDLNVDNGVCFRQESSNAGMKLRIIEGGCKKDVFVQKLF